MKLLSAAVGPEIYSTIIMTIKFLFVLLLISGTKAQDIGGGAPKLETASGWLQGTYEKSYNGRLYSAFRGIPYARPPLDDLRFQPPRENYNWTGTWIANTKHTCIHMIKNQIVGDEDCLYLNVYVPRTEFSQLDNLNVIVHIHGGGLSFWDSHTYSGPEYLMDEEVIFVTMNYRLGALGFLSTEDDVIPGNNGLKDQTQSLRWIQKNIRFFGGNPDSVTLTGTSAGAMSVHYHYFSDLSRGLFHRGVSHSGTALSPWALMTDPYKNSKILAEKLGCEIDNSRDILDCLRARSAKKIIEAHGGFLSDPASVIRPFGTVIEKIENGFLTGDPHEMLLRREVADLPWVVSVIEEESSFFSEISQDTLDEKIEKLDIVGPLMLGYSYLPEETRKATTERIKDYYFMDHKNEKTYIAIFDDRMFRAPLDTSAKLQAKANKSPVYAYVFGYRGETSFLEHILDKTDHISVTHCDDVQYYLRSKISKDRLTENDEKMKDVFLRWLTTFADNKEPQIEGKSWRRVSGDDVLEFLYFEDPEGLHLEVAEGYGADTFWSQLPLKEYENRRKTRDEL